MAAVEFGKAVEIRRGKLKGTVGVAEASYEDEQGAEHISVAYRDGDQVKRTELNVKSVKIVGTASTAWTVRLARKVKDPMAFMGSRFEDVATVQVVSSYMQDPRNPCPREVKKQVRAWVSEHGLDLSPDNYSHCTNHLGRYTGYGWNGQGMGSTYVAIFATWQPGPVF